MPGAISDPIKGVPVTEEISDQIELIQERIISKSPPGFLCIKTGGFFVSCNDLAQIPSLILSFTKVAPQLFKKLIMPAKTRSGSSTKLKCPEFFRIITVAWDASRTMLLNDAVSI